MQRERHMVAIGRFTNVESMCVGIEQLQAATNVFQADTARFVLHGAGRFVIVTGEAILFAKFGQAKGARPADQFLRAVQSCFA